MASQKDLLELIPDEDDLRTVRDPAVREVLEFIFQVDASIDMVCNHNNVSVAPELEVMFHQICLFF